MMVDWVSGFVETPPELWPGYESGFQLTIGPTGELIRRTSFGLAVEEDVEGSASRNIFVRTPTPGALYLSGNPVKLLQNHNAFGSSDAVGLYMTGGAFVRQVVGLFPGGSTWSSCKFEGPRFTRLDLTRSYRFPHAWGAREWLQEVAGRSRDRRGGTQLEGDTVYFGKRSTRWTMKLYHKGDELIRLAEKKHQAIPPEVIEWSQGVVRFELTLRTPELRKHAREVARLRGPFADAYALDLWKSYYCRVTWNGGAMTKRRSDAERELRTDLKLKLAAWREGQDMRALLSKSAFYRARRELLETVGMDIATSCAPARVVEYEAFPDFHESGWDPEPLPGLVVLPDPELLRQYSML